MDRLLGEPVEASELKERDLIWLNGAFRAVVTIQKFTGFYKIHTLEGLVLEVADDQKAMRGHRFLVARRID